MFIPDNGGEAHLQPYKKGLDAVTLALTDPSGTVEFFQMGPEVADPNNQIWFPYTINNEAVKLDSANTARALYAPMLLKVVASGTGVRKYQHGGEES